MVGEEQLGSAAHADSSIENLNSNVVLLSYGSNTVLLGGDCEAPCEADYTTGPVQVYKVHHHGASDASSADLLTDMDPYTALISVG
ncbi:MAG: hypothetical protein R3304_06320, partial [Longimicrobiales bacterium]|nr:hypothetical protein [Longimicrobiales bacterium]